MAELNIGLHCSIPSCNKLDFLPFECDGCSQVFCLEHKGRTAHKCSDVNFERKGHAVKKPTYTCSLDGCEAKELVCIACSCCHSHFCLKHRLPEDHHCINIPNTSSLKSSITSSAEHKPKLVLKQNFRSSKSEKTAAKVALIKLKMNAVGNKSIPDKEKIYLSVLNDMSGSQHAFYVSSQWSVGKVIDYIADQLSINNENHTNVDMKLRLCSASTRNVYPSHQLVLNLLNENILFSGSSVVFAKLPASAVSME